MDPAFKAAELGDFSDESDELEHTPADILATVGPAHTPLSPTHSPGHVTPGHVVGRPIHDSPKQHHIEIHLDPEPHLGGLRAKTLESKGSTETLVDPAGRAPGSEPGVDVRRPAAKRAYAHIHENCEIEVIDYSAESIKFRQFNNDSFLDFLQTTDRTPPLKVRWINIGGLSWDIISGLAIKYQLHPLAIEDILHSRSTSRSKADYYQRHLFLSVVTHAASAKKQSLLSDKYLREGELSSSDSASESSGTENEEPEEVEEENRKTLLRRVTTRRKKRTSKNVDIEMTPPKRQESKASSLRWMDATALLSPEGRRREDRIAKLNALKRRDRVRVIVSNAFFFLFKDGTVISIHQGDRAFGNPIYQRLLHADTVLRKDPEGSLLLQALLDLIVDQALQVVDKYSDKINESETQVLLKPNMNTVRSLHILSADLTMRKRAIEPLKSLIYGLRRFDVERTAACIGVSAATATAPVQGYMSAKTKIYLSDVSDHLESILSSLDQFSTMTDNLIDFTFNMNAHSSNEQMKRMTILMCIFLPLTLLTGYFGMNFQPMPAVDNHSDVLFWQIAVPVMAVVLPLALWGDIVKMFRYFSKNKLLARVEKKQMAKVKSAKKAEMKRRRTLQLGEKTA